MAVTLGYKGFPQSPRSLTQESMFTGGMMHTGNTVGDAFLKSIVNADFDDITGYIKNRKGLKFTELAMVEQASVGYSAPEIILGVYDILVDMWEQPDPAVDAWYITSNASRKAVVYSRVPLEDMAPTIPAGLLDVRPTITTVCTSNIIVAIIQEGVMQYTNPGIDLIALPVEPSTYLQLTTEAPYIPVQYIVYDTPEDLIAYNGTIHYRYMDISGSFVSPTSSKAHIGFFRVGCINSGPDKGKYFVVAQGAENLPEEIKELYDVTLNEASTIGYNAALGSNMYNYTCKTPAISNPLGFLEGVLFKEYVAPSYAVTYQIAAGIDKTYYMYETETPVVLPKAGKKLLLDVIWTIQASSVTGMATSEPRDDAHLKVEFRISGAAESGASEGWETLYEWEAGNHKFAITIPDGTFQIRTTLSTRHYTSYMNWDGTTSILDVQLYTYEPVLSSVKTKTYDLATATGMCVWRNRLVAWGVYNAEQTIFMSDVDNPYYFPYPQNINVFEESVLSCMPYMDALLIFTNQKIYAMKPSETGGYVVNCIQNKLMLSAEDCKYIRTIKNMVLFKADKYFYMVVPKTGSFTNELTIAPIYKNIASFFDSPEDSISTLLKEVYADVLTPIGELSIGIPLLKTVYTDQDVLRIQYHTAISNSHTAVTLLNYNTNSRAWSLYVFSTIYPDIITYRSNAARDMMFISAKHNSTTNRLHLGLYEFSNISGVDETDAVLQNRIYIDTGYRTFSDVYKKRFREVQLKLFAAAGKLLEFGTQFFVDGQTRKDCFSFKTEKVGDSYTLVPEYDVNLSVPGHTDLDTWTLSESILPGIAPIKIRIPVSGKGYSPRFTFLSSAPVQLELNSISWVYRPMQGR